MKNSKSDQKFKKVMHEYGQGELKSHGEKVTNQKQAVAIAFSEARDIDPEYRMKKKGGSIEQIKQDILDVKKKLEEDEEADVSDELNSINERLTKAGIINEDEEYESGYLLKATEPEQADYYLQKIKKPTKMNNGGITGEQAAALAKIYKQGTAKQLWEFWDDKSRWHFLADHMQMFMEALGDNTNEAIEKYKKEKYEDLPASIQREIVIHHAMGMYAGGGGVEAAGRVKTIKESDIKVGEKFNLINGEVVEIKRLFKENIDEDWVEFTRSSVGRLEESSVNQLKNFINNWRADKKQANGGSMAGGGGVDFELGTPAVHHYKDYTGEQKEESGEITMNREDYHDKKSNLLYSPKTIKGISLYRDKDYSGDSERFIVPNWNNVETFYEASARQEKDKKFVVKTMAGGGGVSEYKTEMSKINERQLANTLKEIQKAIRNKQTWKLYEQYEDDNYHSENTILLAQTVGNENDKQETLDIWRSHAMAGSIPDDVYQKRNLLSKKLWPKFVANAVATEGLKMAQGGEYGEREGGSIKKYNEGAEISSKLSPAKKKLLDRINTLKSTKANAGAAAQKAIQKKIDVLQKQFDYNPSAKERALANKGKFALDVPTKHSKFIYKKLWGMKILPRIHTLNGTSSIVVNSQINLVKAYRIYSDLLKEKGEPVPALSKISRKL